MRSVRTFLGRAFRDIVRKTRDDAGLREIFAEPLSLAFRVRHQRQNQRGPKIYSLRAPEVECIGKGKAHRPYEFGVKVSVATTLARSKGGQFIAHVKALPGNPYDGHTLETVIPEIETQIGASLARIVADRGYRGHNAPPDHKMKVYISGQKRGVTGGAQEAEALKRNLLRRGLLETVQRGGGVSYVVKRTLPDGARQFFVVLRHHPQKPLTLGPALVTAAAVSSGN